ncbi:hypothetical protein I4641_06150 [Waterburya agarophytonicola K14]|uniref:DUF5895 domain-containing protein n=1 Tax=Waterburya agarophytonicola KI4 TaxID=2874699 RepID=A0A964BNW0_9CYAN|nr:DUF5895 domain-containing protein [Waterburya agarophytonicola]MCC0176559.1 hypothetical protein [Waterburya agarophytonicola KI4]
MNNYQDFGFNSEEFLGELTSIPYCQFLNGSNKNYGIAITPSNAELANFELIDSWKPIEHEFSDGTNEILLVTNKPRLLILNRSLPLMSNEVETIAYNKEKFQEGEYKAFSYVVVWFLNDHNKPLSELPFRLKCSGYAGLTFLKNYSYYNNPSSFCKKFLQVYKSLTGDRAVDKNEVFYAHGVYQVNLTRQKATSTINGQSSFAVMTDSFLEPTKSNFSSLIIKNGSELSNKIKGFIESTESWLQIESIKPETKDNVAEIESSAILDTPKVSEENGIEAGLTPELIPF